MDRKIAKRFYCYIEIVDVAYFLKEVSKDNTGRIGEAISKEKIFPLGEATNDLFVKIFGTFFSNLKLAFCAHTLHCPGRLVDICSGK